MRFSKFAPSLIYANMPAVILAPITRPNKELHDAFMTALSDLGVIPITSRQCLSAIQTVLAISKQAMPYNEIDVRQAPKARRATINKAREDFVDEVLNSIAVDLSGKAPKFLFNKKDITAGIEENLSLQAIEHQQTWINHLNAHLSRILEAQAPKAPIAFIATDPRRFTSDKLNPAIGLIAPDQEPFILKAGHETRIRKKSDIVIPMLADVEAMKKAVAAVVNDFTNLRERNAVMREDLNQGRIKLEKQFTRESWPGHVLMANVKKEVRKIVRMAIDENNIVCDALDLEYQTLFRLTSLPVASVFEDGDALEVYLRQQNAYAYWRDILALDPQKVANPIKTSLVREIVEEQLIIIRERMQNTSLPLNKLIRRQGIFAESDWKLQKYAGKLAAIKVGGEKGEKVVNSKEVTFKPVDIGYAKELHSTLHYIHTPRAIKAFGLYLENDPIPFSVVAFDTIDRPYKKDLLLMHGYNPSKCLDLARLYSRPGTPFNTSSTIFTLAFSYFRENEPEVQAILSAFMPTYAHGMSMISAGFNYGVLVKEWRHSFAEREIGGQKVWELVTKRRLDDTQAIIDSQWPLLPVFELMASLQPPRFTPFSELDGMMLSRNL